MPTTNVMMTCVKCQKKTLHIEQKINHVLQLLLSIVTAGLWLIVWALLVFFHDKKTQCTLCGHNKGFMNDIMAGTKFRPDLGLAEENTQVKKRNDTLLIAILFIVLISILGLAIYMVER